MLSTWPQGHSIYLLATAFRASRNSMYLSSSSKLHLLVRISRYCLFQRMSIRILYSSGSITVMQSLRAQSEPAGLILQEERFNVGIKSLLGPVELCSSAAELLPAWFWAALTEPNSDESYYLCCVAAAALPAFSPLQPGCCWTPPSELGFLPPHGPAPALKQVTLHQFTWHTHTQLRTRAFQPLLRGTVMSWGLLIVSDLSYSCTQKLHGK